LLSFGCQAKKETMSISADAAFAIAQKTPEVKALRTLYDGALQECLETKVVRPCDSQGWVTCVDNAWVVQYELSAACPVKSDGRLAANFLIDGMSGKVISKYPEVEYFADPQFCRDNADCLCSRVGNFANTGVTCLNFIHAPFKQDVISPCGQCICKNGRCRQS
jgi:hypothetical protein